MSPLIAIAYREYRIRLRNPIFPLWDILVPVVYLVVFGASFKHLMGSAAGVDYPTFLLAGVLSMVSFSIAMNSSYAFFEDLQSGTFHELLTFPFPRRDLLIGKLLFNAAFGVIASAVCVLAGVAALKIRIPPAYLPGLTVWVLLGTAAWYLLFTLLALLVRGFNAYHTTSSTLYIVLMFISNLFYPADQLPHPLQWAAWANPVTWQTNLLRYYTLAGAPPHLQVQALAFVAFLAASFWISNRTLNGTIE